MSATLWHDPMTDERTIKDGDHAETISPFVRQAMIDEHERLAKELDRECDEWSHAYDRLKDENAKLRELVRRMWLTCKTKGIIGGVYTYPDRNSNVDERIDFRKAMRELGIEVDE